MPQYHDFWNGSYDYDPLTHEKLREGETLVQKRLRETACERIKLNKLYLFIRHAEAIINNEKFYSYYVNTILRSISQPENTLIISDNEYLKIEKKEGIFYRKCEGNYMFTKILCNKKLANLDNVQEIFGFLICIQKGRGKIYTKEEFRKKFLI